MFLIKIAIFVSLLIVYELTEKLLQLKLPKVLFVQVNYSILRPQLPGILNQIYL